MTKNTNKLAVLFSILALACGTGCAAEAAGDDAADPTAPTAQAPVETAAQETPAPARRHEEVRGVQLDLPAHGTPGDDERSNLRQFAQPPQPCPQLTAVGEEAR